MNPKEAQLQKKKGGSPLDFITNWGMLLIIAILFVFFAVSMPGMFLTGDNMITILRNISITTVIAVGLTFALSVNGMDLSIGANANFAAAFVTTTFVWYGMQSIGVSILLTIIVCLSVAAVNCLLIVKFKIMDMIASLATMFIFQGIALTYTRGGAVTERMMMPDGSQAPGLIPPEFKALGKAEFLIPIMLIVVVFAFFFLTYTKHGRYMYAVGGNPEAARLSGIPVSKYRVLAYVFSSIFAALGGIMLAAYIGSSQVKAGDAYLMPSVAAAYIGFSVAGAGKANPFGTLAGAALVGLLDNGFIMMSVPYYAMDIVKGCVLAAALALTYARKKN
ncbi:MAG: ABC transporter permease [Christensenella sp.]|uniref:ABC transporter permease n=1 Tax=Christensenella sp. TaxID=1935934 RepID=UPI002B210666|nr:ABC transporter permease [Christensenella sp.]MEA5004064.1 ABC transporter permease [Christensenella sp.]